MAVDCQVSDLIFSSPEPLAHGESDRWMSVVSCVLCILSRQQLTGPCSAVGNVGFQLEEGGGDFPHLLRHVSPATFDKFV